MCFPIRGATARRLRACRRSLGREIKDRAARLREKGEAALARYLQSQVGRDVELLMERDGIGRTPGFAEVKLERSSQPQAIL